MKKIKIITICLFTFLLCLTLSACNNTTNQTNISNKIENSLNTITVVLKETETISTTDLVIAEIMDEYEVSILTSVPNSTKQIVRYDNNKTGYNGATFTSANVYQGRYLNTDENFKYNTLTNYVAKLEQLHDIASDTISANNNAKYLKTNIQSKVNGLKSVNAQLKSGEITLNNEQCNAIEDLLNNLNANVNKVNFSKKELTNEIKSVKTLKNNYANNIEQLNSKYTRLLNCLDTRCSYFSNCLGCLDGIYNCILNGTTSIDELLYYYGQSNANQNNECYDENGNCINSDCADCDNENCYDGECAEQTGLQNNQSNYEYRNQSSYNNYNTVYGINNGYGYAGYWGNQYYPRNINSFGGPRNINSFRDNFYRRNNINTYRDLNTNIDSYRNDVNTKVLDKNPKNQNDPYRILPSSINDNESINTNIQTNKDDIVKSSYEIKEMFYGNNPYDQGKNKGYFRVYKVVDGKVIQDEINEISNPILDESSQNENNENITDNRFED